MEFKMNEIGYIEKNFGEEKIRLNKEYKEGLTGLKGFSHIIVIWWANKTQDIDMGLVLDSPYKNGPDKIGIFATRTQIRPNPICISVMDIKEIDFQNGTISTHYIDAEDKTPILDIKPYTPSSDRVRTISVPDWCSHWPQNTEESGYFDWAAEFNFEE